MPREPLTQSAAAEAESALAGDALAAERLAEIRKLAVNLRLARSALPDDTPAAMLVDLWPEVERLQALIAAGLKVADILDGDTEWAARQIRTALTTGAVTSGAPW